jgi:hypothetical protein
MIVVMVNIFEHIRACLAQQATCVKCHTQLALINFHRKGRFSAWMSSVTDCVFFAFLKPVDSVREYLLHFRCAHFQKPVSQNTNYTHLVT